METTSFDTSKVTQLFWKNTITGDEAVEIISRKKKRSEVNAKTCNWLEVIITYNFTNYLHLLSYKTTKIKNTYIKKTLIN